MTAEAVEASHSSNTDERSPQRWTQIHNLAVLALVAAAVARLWVPPLGSSLWLDETGTVWLLKGSLLGSLRHALSFQGGSPLYYVVEWSAKTVLGASELALRAPSVLGMALAAYLLFRLGRRLFDAGTGAIASLVFVSLPIVAFAAVDARPYALAIAALVGSTLALTRWLDTARPRDGIVYAVTLSTTVYLHYLFALPLLAHGVYLLFRLGRGTPVRRKELFLTYGLAAVLLAPAVPTLARVMSQRSILSNPYPQSAGQVFTALLPTALAWIVVGGVALFAVLIWPPPVRGWNANDGAVPLVVAWFAITFLTLVILSGLTSTDVMVPRYFISVTPALALLIAVLVRRTGSQWAQLTIVAAFAIWSMTHFYTSTHTAEDWRAAARLERSLVDDRLTPVLLFSGFIEAKQENWLADPVKSSYLNAPEAAYPLEGRVLALPFGFDPGAPSTYMMTIETGLQSADQFVLVTRGSDTFNGWLSERLGSLGFTSTLRGNFGGQVLVYEFVKNG